MKLFTNLTGILLLAICAGGCARTLPPHEELGQAVQKSFEATGFNYSSISTVTDLALPPKTQDAALVQKSKLPLNAGLEVIRGLSVNVDGAVDLTAKKSQAIYGLRYEKDNVEVSIKLPVLMDYGTQTLYVGTSLFTSMLEALYPQAPATRGKLIRFDLNALLREATASKPDLAKVVGDNRFSGKNFDLINDAFKAAVLKELPKLNDRCFSDRPLSEQDRKRGVARRVRVQLDHGDSVALVLDAVEGISESLYHQGVISKQEYAVLLTLTDRQFLGDTVEKFSLAMTFDVGIASSGHVAYLEGQYNVGDREGLFRAGMANVTTFTNYGAPQFSLSPEQSGVVDFTELLKGIAATATEESKENDDADCPEEEGATGSSLKKDI